MLYIYRYRFLYKIDIMVKIIINSNNLFNKRQKLDNYRICYKQQNESIWIDLINDINSSYSNINIHKLLKINLYKTEGQKNNFQDIDITIEKNGTKVYNRFFSGKEVSVYTNDSFIYVGGDIGLEGNPKFELSIKELDAELNILICNFDNNNNNLGKISGTKIILKN